MQLRTRLFGGLDAIVFIYRQPDYNSTQKPPSGDILATSLMRTASKSAFLIQSTSIEDSRTLFPRRDHLQLLSSFPCRREDIDLRADMSRTSVL